MFKKMQVPDIWPEQNASRRYDLTQTLHIHHEAIQGPRPSGHELPRTCFVKRCFDRTASENLHIHHGAIERPVMA